MAPHIFSEIRMREVSKYHQYGDRGRFNQAYFQNQTKLEPNPEPDPEPNSEPELSLN